MLHSGAEKAIVSRDTGDYVNAGLNKKTGEMIQPKAYKRSGATVNTRQVAEAPPRKKGDRCL